MTARKVYIKTIGLSINLQAWLNARAAGQRAMQLFLQPPKPQIRAKEASFLESARRNDLDFEGHRIAVYEWGAAEQPLCFLAYGWAYNAGRWRHYVPSLLEAGYRVLAFDPIGHGNSERGKQDYPTMVRLEQALVERAGGAEIWLGHSFGGGCSIEAIHELAEEHRPRRICLMAVFSEARWIFHQFRSTLGLNRQSWWGLKQAIYRRTGRRLAEFDSARLAAELGDIRCLLVHDPEDSTTSFSNSIRNHQYWPNSALYAAKGGGHHLGTAGITHSILDFLVQGQYPQGVSFSQGLVDADHELRQFFLTLEQDTLHAGKN